MLEIGKSGTSNRLIAAGGAIVSIMLLVMAVPRLLASLYALYPESVLQHTQETDRLPSEQVFQQSSDDLNKALAWFETPKYWENLASLHFLQENSSEISSSESQELLGKSRTETINGLKLSPVDSFAWFRLAIVDKLLGAESESVVDSLRLSIYAGRVVKGLLLPRLTLAFPYLEDVDEEMEALIKDQIRLAWSFQGRQLLEFTVNRPDFIAWINDALIYSPDDWTRFSRDFEKLTQKNQSPRTRQ